jgi:hypothetical protein
MDYPRAFVSFPRIAGSGNEIGSLTITCCPSKYQLDPVPWVVPEKIHTLPTEEMFAVRRGREEKFVSDNSKYIRTSEVEGVN